MNHTLRNVAIATLVSATLSFTSPAQAAGTASGYFRMADNKQEFSHAVALSRARAGYPSQQEIRVYVTTHPVDPALAAGGFDIDTGIVDQLRAVKGGMTRVTLKPDGSVKDLWFMVTDPSDTFNTGGQDSITDITIEAGRVKGHFALAEAQDFFDKT
jgi:hypothetical protein